LDIHKPKPFHSVKEFLSEICVVVIGIAIALGGEQLLESWHWGHAVEAERKVLTTDVKDHLDAFSVRAAQQKCVDERLTELGIVFARHKAGQSLGLAGAVGRPQSNQGLFGAWQVAVADQAMSRMPLEERQAFADAYGDFDYLYKVEQEANSAWITLSALNRSDLLEPGDWPRLLDAYMQLLIQERRVKFLISFNLKNNKMGVPEPAHRPLDEVLSLDDAKALCRPLIAQ